MIVQLDRTKICFCLRGGRRETVFCFFSTVQKKSHNLYSVAQSAGRENIQSRECTKQCIEGSNKVYVNRLNYFNVFLVGRVQCS